jgi:hypothetical protein
MQIWGERKINWGENFGRKVYAVKNWVMRGFGSP